MAKPYAVIKQTDVILPPLEDDELKFLTDEITVSATDGGSTFVDFDLGNIVLARVVTTLLSADPDGLPYGGGVGEIAFDIEGITAWFDQSELDNQGKAHFSSNTGVSAFEKDFPYQYLGFAPPLPAETHAMLGTTSRFIRVRATIWEDFNGSSNHYSGPASPTATWRIDLTYLGGS